MFRRGTTRLAGLMVALVLFGCAATGPSRLPADRFDYGAAIAASTNEQMLLNLVRLRYNEMPVFLDVNTVIAQYQFDARAQLGGEVGFSGAAGPPGDSLVLPEVGGAWSERPTMTYVPRSGPKFIRSLLTPLPPASIVWLVVGNWPVEDVVWGVVRSINGVAPRLPGTGVLNPDYLVMLDALARVQTARAIGVSGGESNSDRTLRFRVEGMDAGTLDAIATLRALWGLDPDTNVYRLILGVVPNNRREIAMLTSSMLDLMRDISALIDVPAEHVVQGKTDATVVLPAEMPYAGRAPIQVKWGRDRPRDAFVSVQKDGWWYSITRTDLRSKRVLMLLNILFQLSEAGGQSGGPLVTVPAGR